VAFVAVLAFGLVCLQYALAPLSEGESRDPTIAQQVERQEDGNRTRQAGLLLLGAAGAAGILSSRRRSRRAGTPAGYAPPLILALATYTLLSVTWADEPALAFKRWIAAILLVTAGLAARSVLGLPGTIRFVFYLTLLQASGGLAWEIVRGLFAPLAQDYRFSGGLHPNGQAVVCVLLLATACVVWKRARSATETGLATAAMPLALVLLLLTRSRTAFASVVLAAGVLILLAARPGWRRIALAACATAVVIVVALAPGARSAVTSVALLGRDTDTDRSNLWRECLEYIAERPVLGYGFNAFWTPDRVEEIGSVEQWGVAEAHSLYLEMLLDGGGAGLGLGLIALAAALAGAWTAWRGGGGPEGALVLVLVLFVVLHGLLESTLIRPTFLMFVTVSVLAGRRRAILAEPRAVRFRPGSLAPNHRFDGTLGRALERR
jgi:O-antigen ligase